MISTDSARLSELAELAGKMAANASACALQCAAPPMDYIRNANALFELAGHLRNAAALAKQEPSA